MGASARLDSMGEWALKNLLKGGFEGRIYPVNPNYEELQGGYYPAPETVARHRARRA